MKAIELCPVAEGILEGDFQLKLYQDN
jgi:hypothetical protein